ncbi:NAD(P)H-binding protein [Vibrio nigripulchritudo]|uniref:NAD(P)H-binding protein n=1 Tax=Vibrio nigripulchritudo TaxID=28173 RepID=UPI002491DFBE|nr:NAD(P)H-binding protein [Vibrio nigripulchritudo]BDU37407.1 nucleoside-diphosphate sugar epimerase [Vibrio nigripulchritudo]BDU43129.1 nucleoside-diphosphate sugar epimerase [Vibrio nigripulchritudo]
MSKIAIVAGGSGLVGHELMMLLLKEDAISQVHSLGRRPINLSHSKLKEHIHVDLAITNWDDETPSPELGFICLGTTLKQAGSKEKLAQIDVDLVCNVAQEMKLVGVKKLAVVSSYGAGPESFSHYLKCKGKMETAVSKMGFEQVVFVRPGPLKGERVTPRTNELVTESLLKVLSPLLIGKLHNFKPIDAKDVAQSMLYALFDTHSKQEYPTILDSRAMWRMLSSYK